MSRRRAQFEIQERGPDEPDLTEKQRQYIEHLLNELEAENFPLSDLDNMGKWQASSLIDRLKELRDGRESNKTKVTEESGSGINVLGWAIILGVILWWLFL